MLGFVQALPNLDSFFVYGIYSNRNKKVAIVSTFVEFTLNPFALPGLTGIERLLRAKV